MPRPLVPYHPLSRTGRVLWCLALALFSAVLMLFWSPAQADDIEALKGESPYFAVNSSEPGVDRLPLKSTEVKVRIAGVIADVTVVQHYRNEGQRPLEARYVFPGSTQAAVYAMQVRLGDRVLNAKIREKQQARIEYQAAKREGKTTALLEQRRPNVFEMNVANILPNDDVSVELRYTELLTPTDARYGFVFPTVVGPRYNSPAADASNGGSIGGAYLRAAEVLDTRFDLDLSLDAPVAVKDIASPSHAIEVQGLGGVHAEVSLKPSDTPRHNRDFILQYRLAGEHVESGLMLYRGPEVDGVAENFFLAMVQPPAAVPARQINPRDYIFVVDISGSMHGYPLDTAKVLMRNLIGGLRASDTFNVMLFSGSSHMLSPVSVPATRANIDRALRTLHETGGGGGTEIVPALRRIAALPKAEEVSRSVIVVTDGYVSVEAEVFRLIRQNLGQANVFAFGIGSSVNRHLIEGMARAGQGEAFIVTRPEQAAAQAERLRRIVEAPVLTQVKATFEGLDAYDVEPAPLPDVMGGRPVVMFGKWRPSAGAAVPARVVLEGRAADGPYRQALAADPSSAIGPAALRQLWARHRIAGLSDQEALEGGQTQKAQITELGLNYGLLTPYTSFIAVDQRVRNPNPAQALTVDAPSPMPEGVSNSAIGAEVPSTPEPGAIGALLVVIGVVVATLWSSRRRRKD
jgi:Ca-activated chloride channel homolog